MQLFGSSAVLLYVMWLDSFYLALWVIFAIYYWYQSFTDGSNSWGADRTDPCGPIMDHPPLGRSKFVSSAFVWYVMKLDYPNHAIWVKFNVWYWYQSLLDLSNISAVERTDYLCHEMEDTLLGRSYLVVASSYDMTCCFIFLNRAQLTRFNVWHWYQSFIVWPNIWCVDRTVP